MRVASGTPASSETRVNLREFRANLTRYLAQVEAGGHFAIISRGKVIARLGPPAELPLAERRARAFGALKGQIRLAPGLEAASPDLLDGLAADLVALR